MKRFLLATSSLSLVLAGIAAPARATRIEELCDLEGVRPNQLTGYGLVVGLSRTGDVGQARFTVQSTAAMLRRLGAHIDPTYIRTENAAAVIVTASMPGQAHPGTRIDVTVSALGNARSLAGGTLVQTPLYGADRNVYAVAQGALIIGGYSARGASGSLVRRNYVTVGRVPRGAIVERRVPTPELDADAVVLTLRHPSFITAQRIVEAIDAHLGEESATAVDSATVRVRAPEPFRDNLVAMLAQVYTLDVEPLTPARVVIDERTGTVVLGGGVRIGEVAIAQGGLTIEISERFDVSQPSALGEGDTAVVPESEVRAQEAGGALHHVEATASLGDVISALNALGASPRDLITIFQALHAVGALRAEIEVL